MRVRRSSVWVGVLVVVALGGCDVDGSGVTMGADAAPPDATPVPVDPSRKICDGSDGLRFAYQVGGGFQPGPPENLFFEPGSSFLYIDGHCHYWVSGAG